MPAGWKDSSTIPRPGRTRTASASSTKPAAAKTGRRRPTPAANTWARSARPIRPCAPSPASPSRWSTPPWRPGCRFGRWWRTVCTAITRPSRAPWRRPVCLSSWGSSPRPASGRRGTRSTAPRTRWRSCAGRGRRIRAIGPGSSERSAMAPPRPGGRSLCPRRGSSRTCWGGLPTVARSICISAFKKVPLAPEGRGTPRPSGYPMPGDRDAMIGTASVAVAALAVVALVGLLLEIPGRRLVG